MPGKSFVNRLLFAYAPLLLCGVFAGQIFEASPRRFFEPERKSAAAAATPAAIEKGRALVEQAIAAVGGAQLYEALCAGSQNDPGD